MIADIVGIPASLVGLGVPTVAVLAFLARRYWRFDRLRHRLDKDAQTEAELRDRWNRARAELENFSNGDAVAHSILTQMPHTRPVRLEDAPSLSWLQDPGIRASAAPFERHDKPHGLAANADFRLPNITVVPFVDADYPTIKAGRNHGHKPPILSGNAILFCPATHEVALQVRAETDTYPHCLHVFGGNYEPPTGLGDGDEHSLQDTALRELKEESRLRRERAGDCIVLSSEEVSTGFVRFTYAALTVASHEKSNVRGGREGPVVWTSFRDLGAYATTGLFEGTRRMMTPTGALDLLIWLRMGCPDEHRRTPLRAEALEVYHRLRRLLPKRLATNPATGH